MSVVKSWKQENRQLRVYGQKVAPRRNFNGKINCNINGLVNDWSYELSSGQAELLLKADRGVML